MGSEARDTRPSRVWYVVGGALLVVAVVGGIVAIVSAVSRTIDRARDFARVDVPGAADIALRRSGPHTIYFESQLVENIPTVRVRLRQVGAVSFLPLRPYNGQFTYDLGGHQGRAVFTFRAPERGRYRVEVEADLAPGQAQLAIGPSVTRGILGRTVVAGLLCFLTFVSGVVVLVVTAVKRSEASRPPKPLAAPYPPHPPPPPAPPPADA